MLVILEALAVLFMGFGPLVLCSAMSDCFLSPSIASPEGRSQVDSCVLESGRYVYRK